MFIKVPSFQETSPALKNSSPAASVFVSKKNIIKWLFLLKFCAKDIFANQVRVANEKFLKINATNPLFSLEQQLQ